MDDENRVNMSSKKKKKQMSRDLNSALVSKRRVANFMDKAEKSSPKPGKYARAPRRDSSDDDDIEIVRDDNGDKGMEEVEDLMMDDVSLNEIDLNASQNDSEDNPENEDEMTLPHMREYCTGISYRKLDCNSVLVSIEPFIQLYFMGKALIKVIKGTVDIYGYRFGADGKKYSVFSAKGHTSLLCVKALQRSGPMDKDGGEGTGITPDELACSQGALIVMEGFENEWCDGMRNTYPTAANMIGPSITGIGPGKLPIMKNFMDKLGFQFVKSSEKVKMMEFPAYWEDLFKDINNQFECSSGKICPFGGKGVGKSTFVKWLANRFLSAEPKTEVLFIDLDPGQTEFTPPGMLSAKVISEPILGPNFCHLKDPDRAIFLGTTSVADFPVSYIKAVVDLYEYCATNERFQGLPWIINTMGYSQGLGVQLACEIINVIRPNCVLQLNIKNDRRSFPFFLNRENVSRQKTSLKNYLPEKYRLPLGNYHFLSVNSACGRQHHSNSNVWGANPKTCRELVITSYFAEKIGSADGFNIRSVVPLKVPLDSIAIGTINSDLSYSEILDTLNGNLVAICEMSDNLFIPLKEASQKKFIQKASLFTNNCLGYGIVRAIDKENELLYIVTPISESEILLRGNVILAAGAVGLPIHFYVGQGQGSALRNSLGAGASAGESPYLMSRNEGTSTLHTAAKKYFVPRKVTHNVLKNCFL